MSEVARDIEVSDSFKYCQDPKGFLSSLDDGDSV